MAWFYMLSAECGESEARAEVFSRYFENTSITLSSGKIVTFSKNIYLDSEKNWWVTFYANNVSHSGAYDLESAIDLSEVGFNLYRLLLTAPEFRYAVAGVECEEFRNFSELKESVYKNNSGVSELKGYFNGIVIKNEIRRALGNPNGFSTFCDGYVWLFYTGETYNGISNESQQKLKSEINKISSRLLPQLIRN